MPVLIMIVFFLLGVAAVVYGVALVSPPAAWVVFGLFCLAIALWPVLRRG